MTNASQTWVVPSKMIDKGRWRIFLFILLNSSWCMKGINYLRWVELVRAYPYFSSKPLKRSILLRGTPAFSIVVTTFTLYTRVESVNHHQLDGLDCHVRVGLLECSILLYSSGELLFPTDVFLELDMILDRALLQGQDFFTGTTKQLTVPYNEPFIWVCFDTFIRWDVLRLTFLLALTPLDTFRGKILLQLSHSGEIRRTWRS